MKITRQLLEKAIIEYVRTHEESDIAMSLQCWTNRMWDRTVTSAVVTPIKFLPELKKYWEEYAASVGWTSEDNVIRYNHPSESFVIRPKFYLGDDIVVLLDVDGLPESIYYTQDSISSAIRFLEEWTEYRSSFVKKDSEVTRYAGLLVRDGLGRFDVVPISLGEKLGIDISKNYSPDLPDESIRQKLESDRGGIFIFHGTPGTGKSTYIKYLMETCQDVKFVMMDPNAILDGAEEFKNYLINNTLSTPINDGEDKNKVVYVLEDAEKILVKRESGTSRINLSNILNVTDGIIGDLIKVKFLCTFNCDIDDIDPAILRKGRLLQIHEFKPLTGEVLKNLADSLEVPIEDRKAEMTLADLYCFRENTGSDSEKDNSRKIGF